MTALRFLTAAATAATAAVAVAAPAAAQPAYSYPNPGAQVLQGVIDSLLGNRYSGIDRRAVHRCADAALEEAYQAFGPRRLGYGRSVSVRNYPQMRVTAITDIDRRAYGLRVHGLIDSGLLYAQPYGRLAARTGDLRFRCVIDYNGVISTLRVNRNPDFRGY